MTTLWAVVGSTGTGKSEFALDLAETLADQGRRAEIVNADALQLYRGMDVGTAKVPLDQRRGIAHHLLDVLNVTQDASVAAYQRDARGVISRLLDSGVDAILVGGSGLYVSSVLTEFEFPGTDPEVRKRLESELAALGPGMLHRRIADIDPETAQQLDPHNGRRLVRALEVIEITGRSSAARLPETPVPWRPSHIFRLEMSRASLVERLNTRVTMMWRNGLCAEVEELLTRGLADGVTARQAIGYAQAWAHIRGEVTQNDAIAETQQLTRQYARRQVNWFSRFRGAQVVSVDAQDSVAHALVGAASRAAGS